MHGITLSREQHGFVTELIRAESLPCTVTLVDFFDYRPPGTFDGAVFMGSLEHIPDYRFVARFLARHLRPEARVYCDFVTTRAGRLAGAFLRKYIFPGITGYVELGRLVTALTTAGFNVAELADDTLSDAWTVRDWAEALQRCQRIARQTPWRGPGPGFPALSLELAPLSRHQPDPGLPSGRRARTVRRACHGLILGPRSL